MTPRRLAVLDDIPEQGHGGLSLDVDGVPIGLFRVGDEIRAWRSVCPHAAAPVCLGDVDGTRTPSDVYVYEYGRDQEILQCPWHGWEFDLLTGHHLAQGSGARLRQFPIEVRDDAVFDASAAASRVSIDTLVCGKEKLAADVVRIQLRRSDGEPFPSWTPGTHVEVTLPSGRSRQYSLCGDPADRMTLEFAAQRQGHGRGGSVELHDAVAIGTELHLTAIRNRFALLPRSRYLLIAGGIGITPLVPMMRALQRRRVPFDLVYSGGSRERMAFLDEIDRVPSAFVIESGRQGRPDLAALLRAAPDRTAVYACGPASMLSDLDVLAQAEGGRLELVTEAFGGLAVTAARSGADAPVTVRLARRGCEVVAEAGTSVLEAIRSNGVDLPSSCEQGWCGSCETTVIDGEIEHRDTVLTEAEQDAGNTMMICVSRATSGRLILDV